MKKIKNDIIEPDTKACFQTSRFMKLKNIVFMLILSFVGTNSMAQTMCPGGGWENEPIQDPDGCCILFDMLPSTLDFPWAYWFVVADGETYNNSDYPTGDFEVCYEDAGMENVVVTYVDAFGVTLCENDWTVFVEKGCGPDIICEDCIDFTGITVETEDLCTFDFEMIYTINPDCGAITIVSESWEYGYFGGHGSGVTDSHTFPGDETYSVIAIIEYTVDATGETCKQEQTVDVNVTGCSPGGIECVYDALISISDDGMEIELPTREPCEDPVYIVEIREFGTEDYVLADATISVLPPYTATITGLDPCTPYETKITLQCEGGIDGICETGEAFVTDCPPPCTGCVITDDIDIISIDGCNYTLEANYETTDACGDTEVTSVDWDLGDGVTATGDIVDISFLCGGMKTVTATISYTTYPDIECTTKITKEINAFACEEECNSCLSDKCIDAREIYIQKEAAPCTYLILFDYVPLGECGLIDGESISIDWDFGHIDGTGTGLSNVHTFPGDGTYHITMTYTYTLEGEIEEQTCYMEIDLEVTGCDEKEGPKRGQFSGEAGKAINGATIKASTIPNPAEDNVTITVIDPTSSSEFDQLQLVIFDINGREVYKGDTRLGAQKMIDVSHFESGLYIYEVRDGETVVLKEKLLIK